MKSFRLNRLFNPDSNRCFFIALDQGLTSDRTMPQGAENLERTVQMLALSGVDALQMSSGQAKSLQSLPGRSKPALVLRADVSNLTNAAPEGDLFNEFLEDSVQQAARLDAAAITLSLTTIPGQAGLLRQCIANIVRVQSECHRLGMPLCVEATAYRAPEKGGLLVVDRDVETLLPLVRQAVDLGADLVQTIGSSDVGSFRRLIEAAGVPVLVRGGVRLPDREVLESTEQLISQGAGGIVYRRNVTQHPDPSGMARALLAVVHERARAMDAIKFIRN